MRKSIACLVALPFALIAACTAQNNSSFDDDGGSGGSGASGTGGAAQGTTTTDAVTVGVGVGGGSTGSSGAPCNTGDDEDGDNDGWTKAQGDCNDCDPNVNPDAVEVIGDTSDPEYEPADENCNDEIDEPPPVCDQGLALNDTNPMNGAKAIDLCQEAGSGTNWGVLGASYVRANGTNFPNPGASVGLMPQFGSNIVPQGGSSMLVLSSGYARPAGHAEACGYASCSTHGSGAAPANFPQNVPSCPVGTTINDDVALEVQIQAPSNATGYSFDFAFLSFEFPQFVCTQWNDQFIALVSPPPMGSINGNISFDANNNPVSVNIALFDHCDPSSISNYSGPNPPNPFCPAGTAFLAGTGFDSWDSQGAGATGWLVTTAPIDGGENFTVRWAIWDTSDQAFDSTVVVDNFRWTAEPGTTVGTDPVPDPR